MSSAEHKRRYFEDCGFPKLMDPIDFHNFFCGQHFFIIILKQGGKVNYFCKENAKRTPLAQ